MLYSRIVFIVCALMLATPITVAAETKTGCQKISQADVIKWIDHIKEYQLTAVLKVDGALINFESRIYGRSPDRLRVDMDMGDEKMSIHQTTVFDGTYQWSESSTGMGSQITKLKLDKVTKKNKPFDTFMYVMGSGLVNGEDLPTSIKTLFEVYKLVPKCDKKTKQVVFSGPLDIDKYRKYVSSSLYAKQRKRGVDSYAKNFAYVQISVNSKSQQVNSYAMGKSADKPTLNVAFKDLKINTPLPADIFNYALPAGKKAIDITNDMVTKLQ